jgi:hypothetical protein
MSACLLPQDNGEGLQELVPSLLSSDTLNPSFYGMRVIADGLAPVIDDIIDESLGKGKGIRQAISEAKPAKAGAKSKDAVERLERARKRKSRRENFAKRKKELRDGLIM